MSNNLNAISSENKPIIKALFELQDIEYGNFHSRLMPTIDRELIIGVRTPELRKYAKLLWQENNALAKEFLGKLPHHYYEENNLHAFLIEQEKDFTEALNLTELFLPYVDNWATCDLFSPKVFTNNLEELYACALRWIKSKHIYTVRYGIGILLQYFLDKEFEQEMLDIVASIDSEEYYVKMMIAWYFATALAKQYDSTLKIFENEKLDVWTHNKAVQKAIESRRISKDQKALLRKLKISKNELKNTN